MEYEHKFERKREGRCLLGGAGVGDADVASSCSRGSGTCQCRICHEEEPECSTGMESPCACSGSLQFAHRGCVQRWCDEKGSTLCEICLQKFQPGYTVPPPRAKAKISQPQPVDVAVTIRGSTLDVPRHNYGAIDVTTCSAPAAPCRSASCCRLVAITLTVLLLLRHLMDVLLIGADHCAFSLLIMLSLRATGILLPLYIVLRLISAIQRGQRQYQLEQIQFRRGEEQLDRSASEEENPRRYTIQIFSS